MEPAAGRTYPEHAAARLGFEVVSGLAADAGTIWRHAITPAGVNAELAPLLRMTFPRDVRELASADVPLGERLFRSQIRLFGVVPVEWDDVTFVAIEPGRRFLERSTLLTQHLWEHERVVTADGGGARLTDRLRFEPRIETLGAMHWSAFRAVFAWRHRRLRARFGARALDFRVETPRLTVRPWRDGDRPVLTRLATDPRIMRWIAAGDPWGEAEIESFLDRQRRLLATRGYCLGAVVARASEAVIGIAGLQPLGTTEDVEIGWWLLPSEWGRGHATEVGGAVMRFAFDVAGLERVVAISRPDNARSIGVMERLGMEPLGTATGADLGLGVPDMVVVRFARTRAGGAIAGG